MRYVRSHATAWGSMSKVKSSAPTAVSLLDHVHQTLQLVAVHLVCTDQVADECRGVALEEARGQFAHLGVAYLLFGHERPIDVLTPLLAVRQDTPLLEPREQSRNGGESETPDLRHGGVDLLGGSLSALPEYVENGELEFGQGMAIRQRPLPVGDLLRVYDARPPPRGCPRAGVTPGPDHAVFAMWVPQRTLCGIFTGSDENRMTLVASKTASIRSQCMRRARLAGWMACVAVPVIAAPTAAQAPPGTDILIADLGTFNGVYYLVGDPKNVTKRPEAYDNQPFFTPDSRSILFTAAYEDGNDGQTEIHRYYLSARRIARITRTAESEYSPTPVPGDRAFSAIRVEADSTQRLWRFTMEGMDPEVLLPNLDPVGYHAWADPNTLLLFVLGEPSTLRLADLRTARVEIVAENVGRSIHKIPTRNAFSFTQRVSDDEAWITELDPNTKETTRLVRTLSGGDFHAWTPDGTLLMADGGSIYQWNPGRANGWQRIADLSRMGLEFSRLAVSPDGTKIALVGQAAN